MFMSDPAVLDSFFPGQRVCTSFGPGIVEAFSRIDSIVYVTLAKERAGLYLFRPEQVEPLEDQSGPGDSRE